MPKDAKGHGSNPRGTLKKLDIPVGANFHTLHSSKVDELVQEAKRVGYRKPANANGSTGRYFHDSLQRGAGKQTDADAQTQLRAGSGPKSDPVPIHNGTPGVGPNDPRAGSREYDSFGRPRSPESLYDYDEGSRDMALRSRNGQIGSGMKFRG